MTFLRSLCLLAAAFSCVVVVGADDGDGGGDDRRGGGESIFRRALASHRSRPVDDPGRWTPWIDAAASLRSLSSSSSGEIALDAVGALEESILVIERSVMGSSGGIGGGGGGGDGGREDRSRDAALSRLYYSYAAALADLSPNDCIALATSPHTLLLGAETISETADADAVDADRSGAAKLCVENAENSLRNAASLDATNVDADELLKRILGESAAAGSGGAHERKPKEFVAALFDDFAETFDVKLRSLEYKVPGLVGKAARDMLAASSSTDRGRGRDKFRAALDAGCGTGLAGRYLRPLVAGPIVGVDASRKMLDVAEKCTRTSGCGLGDDGAREEDDDDTGGPLYDKLLEMDLEDMTAENTLHRAPGVDAHSSGVVAAGGRQKFDLVVAADVLVYFGSLDSLLRTFSSLSAPGAMLIFSCERADDDEAPLGWRLLPSGRFAHTRRHATEAAARAGYRPRSYEEIVPRMEKGEEVRGHLFGFVRGDDGETSKDEL